MGRGRGLGGAVGGEGKRKKDGHTSLFPRSLIWDTATVLIVVIVVLVIESEQDTPAISASLIAGYSYRQPGADDS